MNKFLSLFLVAAILVLSSLAGSHMQGSMQNFEVKSNLHGMIMPVESCGTTAGGEASQGDTSHPCHIGHVGHCLYSFDSENSFVVGNNAQRFLGHYSFSHIDPYLSGLLRPPIS